MALGYYSAIWHVLSCLQNYGLIEASHIAQNMMLAATEHNLTCCPTAALVHGRISEALKLEKLTHAPVYALTIGHPGPNLDKTTAWPRAWH